MTLSDAQRILKLLKVAHVDAYIFDGYSGRGMYGKKTTGVVIAQTYEWHHALAAVPTLDTYHYDSLGKGTIFY